MSQTKSPMTPEERAELNGRENLSTKNQSQESIAPEVRRASPIMRFFLRTVFAILLTVLLVVGGALGYMSMVKESNPDIAVASPRSPQPGAEPTPKPSNNKSPTN